MVAVWESKKIVAARNRERKKVLAVRRRKERSYLEIEKLPMRGRDYVGTTCNLRNIWVRGRSSGSLCPCLIETEPQLSRSHTLAPPLA